MFLYLSFLRPPPLQALTSGSVLITPQIANDLRTEPFDGSQDIFFSWSQSVDFTTSTHKVITKPIKLTTWRKANAYKEIPVPIPPTVRNGQSWRLILSISPQDSSVIDLGDKHVGGFPFAVMSMPILFGSRSPRGGGKQEQIERTYQLRAGGLEELGLLFTITEQTSFDLDKKAWDSGIGLSSWLVELSNSSTTSKLKDVLFSPENRNILELGAGTGIVALTLAACRSSKHTSPEGNLGRIVTTDLESAMPLLKHNITANSHLYGDICPEAAVLDWDDEVLPSCIRDFTEGFHAIVMADVTYNTASFPSLVRTLSSLMKMGDKPPVVLLGYKERDEAERTLWDLASEAGLNFEKTGEREGAGGAPVEIWFGELKLP